MKTRASASVLLAGALLAGCATQPVPLRGDYPAITPEDAAAGDRTGASVRWGGRVIEVEPQAARTCFTMLSTRLDASGRPDRASEATGGRFLACRPGFYDPAVFAVDREVTFTGRIEGYENRSIGEYDYRFPRIDADVVYLWPEREDVRVIVHHDPYPWRGWWWW
ncbi:Slp family lipoprotein [Luteimonas sp. SJ-92]|uniref:Slp family lipoprotein n=1 Tax=Luteimonas salinisoli TaxID=2752307 RepID=A0A853JCD0_9GAMM|nr:Slp family lipoprotein [Luteimonas salinisoli]NZA26913.1 Slp family lipoprotein [Luteimonas salinisoli]